MTTPEARDYAVSRIDDAKSFLTWVTQNEAPLRKAYDAAATAAKVPPDRAQKWWGDLMGRHKELVSRQVVMLDVLHYTDTLDWLSRLTTSARLGAPDMSAYVKALKICTKDHENVMHWEPIDYGTNKGSASRGKKEAAPTSNATSQDEN